MNVKCKSEIYHNQERYEYGMTTFITNECKKETSKAIYELGPCWWDYYDEKGKFGIGIECQYPPSGKHYLLHFDIPAPLYNYGSDNNISAIARFIVDVLNKEGMKYEASMRKNEEMAKRKLLQTPVRKKAKASRKTQVSKLSAPMEKKTKQMKGPSCSPQKLLIKEPKSKKLEKMPMQISNLPDSWLNTLPQKKRIY